MFPAERGFQMPPEWFPHQRTLMEWPLREALWPGPFEALLPAYANIVKTIARFEPVTLVAHPRSRAEAERFCSAFAQIIPIEHDDSWIRDNGPTFLRNTGGELAGVNWIFNGWGGKYPADKDNQVAAKLLNHWGLPCFDAPFVMEGGSFHVDGEGTALVTEECLCHPNRNPGLTQEEIENGLCKYLNVTRVIWLKRGWIGDDTDGHVDNVACFARPGTIIVQVCSDRSDPNYFVSQENLEILQKAVDARGRNFTIIPIEQPEAVYYENTRLTLSYLNFYFVNGGLILPTFAGRNSASDQKAQAILTKTFPGRTIAPVDGLVVARGGGNVHCLTQQVPEGKQLL